MAIQYSVALRTAQAAAVGTTLGSNFTTKIFTGSPPANCAASDSGTELVSFTSCNFDTAASGAIALTGTPETATAGAGGTTGHFRMYNGATCHVQGTVATSGGDMTVDNTSIALGQTVNIASFALTRANS
jgi:hypothetical protein